MRPDLVSIDLSVAALEICIIIIRRVLAPATDMGTRRWTCRPFAQLHSTPTSLFSSLDALWHHLNQWRRQQTAWRLSQTAHCQLDITSSAGPPQRKRGPIKRYPADVASVSSLGMRGCPILTLSAAVASPRLSRHQRHSVHGSGNPDVSRRSPSSYALICWTIRCS